MSSSATEFYTSDKQIYWLFCFLKREFIFQWVQGLSFLNIYQTLNCTQTLSQTYLFLILFFLFRPFLHRLFFDFLHFFPFRLSHFWKNNNKYIFSMIRALGLRVLNYEERHCYLRHYFFFSNNLKEVGKAQKILIYTKSYIPSTFWPISFAIWPRDSYPETTAVEWVRLHIQWVRMSDSG